MKSILLILLVGATAFVSAGRRQRFLRRDLDSDDATMEEDVTIEDRSTEDVLPTHHCDKLGDYCRITSQEGLDHVGKLAMELAHSLDAKRPPHMIPHSGHIVTAYSRSVNGKNYVVLYNYRNKYGPKHNEDNVWCVMKIHEGLASEEKPRLVLLGMECSSFPDSFQEAVKTLGRIVLGSSRDSFEREYPL